MSLLKQIFRSYVSGFEKFYDFTGRATMLEFWSFALINAVIMAINLPLYNVVFFIFLVLFLCSNPKASFRLAIGLLIVSATAILAWFIGCLLLFSGSADFLSSMAEIIAVIIPAGIDFFLTYFPYMAILAIFTRRLNDANCTPIGLVALLGLCAAFYYEQPLMAWLCSAVMFVLLLLPSKKSESVWGRAATKVFAKNDNTELKDDETAVPKGENK